MVSKATAFPTVPLSRPFSTDMIIHWLSFSSCLSSLKIGLLFSPNYGHTDSRSSQPILSIVPFVIFSQDLIYFDLSERSSSHLHNSYNLLFLSLEVISCQPQQLSEYIGTDLRDIH